MNDPGKDVPDETLYPVSGADPPPPSSGPSPASATEDPAVWYVAPPGGKQEGPLTLAELKRRIADHLLLAEDLVWKAGMNAWAPARTLPALFPGQSPPPTAPPPPLPKGSWRDSLDRLHEPLGKFATQAERIEVYFSGPALYRWIGRVSAVLAVVVLFCSIVFWPWPWTRHLAWFSGAFLFALITLLAEGLGALLEGVQRHARDHQARPDDRGPQP